MRIALLVVQVLLGAHTLIGAVWKVSNAESQVPSLAALPHAIWLALGGVEVLAAVALVGGAMARPLARGVPFAAAFVVAEMLLFTGVHLASGATEHAEVVYWLVVALIAGGLAWARRPSAASGSST